MPPNSALPGRRILLAGMAGSIAASCARPAPADTAARPTDTWPGVGWEYATPEQAGWDTGALAAAHAYAQAIGTATFTVVQHGRMVARWGDVSRKLELHSMRKSLLSALIGIAVTEGRIDLDATLASLGLDDAPPSLTPAEKQATIRELLQSRSGVYHVALYETPGEVAARPDRGSHPPGSFWYYNNWDFNVLGTIYERAAGETIAQAFMARIATPLAMQDYRVTDSRYVRDDAVSLFPAYPFRMSARDLARFGLLYARAGRWRDQAVVPAAWVRDSTRAYSMTTIDSGYGYLWWTGFPDRRVPLMDLPANAFWADGAHGQFICVDPANDLVAVHQTDGSNVSTRQKGHLMWLVQTAARIPDPGSDPNGEVRPGRSGRSRQL